VPVAVSETARAGAAAGEARGVGGFWEGPQGGEFGFGGSAEDTIIALAAAEDGAYVMESGLVYHEIVGGGGGRRPVPSDTVRVHYEGRVSNSNTNTVPYRAMQWTLGW
jgi:hypothetical protein